MQRQRIVALEKEVAALRAQLEVQQQPEILSAALVQLGTMTHDDTPQNRQIVEEKQAALLAYVRSDTVLSKSLQLRSPLSRTCPVLSEAPLKVVDLPISPAWMKYVLGSTSVPMREVFIDLFEPDTVMNPAVDLVRSTNTQSWTLDIESECTLDCVSAVIAILALANTDQIAAVHEPIYTSGGNDPSRFYSLYANDFERAVNTVRHYRNLNGDQEAGAPTTNIAEHEDRLVGIVKAGDEARAFAVCRKTRQAVVFVGLPTAKVMSVGHPTHSLV